MESSGIDESWHRVRLTGLTPTVGLDRPVDDEIDPGCTLLRAAEPILEGMREQIAGERLAVMLADSRARMLTTLSGIPQLDTAAEEMGAVPGSRWTEEQTGTNGLATPFETHRPIFVRGADHYVESLRRFSCYGAPIVGPGTGRLAGVLDVMSEAGREHPLMRSFVDGAVRDIQTRLRTSGESASRSLLRELEEASSHPAAIVVAFSERLVMQSPTAARLLDSADLQLLRTVEPGDEQEIVLSDGRQATASARRTSGGSIVVLHARRRRYIPRTVAPRTRAHRIEAWLSASQGRSAMIVGESGTGRSRVVAALADGRSVRWVSARDTTDAEIERVLRDEAREHGAGYVAVDEVGLLGPRALSALRDALSDEKLVVGTSLPAGHDDHVLHGVLARFPHRLELPSVRTIRHEIFDLIAMLSGPGVRHRFSSSAARALSNYPWPGNLTEIQEVLAHLNHLRGAVVDLPDLPERVRAGSGLLAMTPWQQATFDAMTNALELMHGNKAHAADYLGISRTTLYKRMREYGIFA